MASARRTTGMVSHGSAGASGVAGDQAKRATAPRRARRVVGLAGENSLRVGLMKGKAFDLANLSQLGVERLERDMGVVVALAEAVEPASAGGQIEGAAAVDGEALEIAPQDRIAERETLDHVAAFDVDLVDDRDLVVVSHHPSVGGQGQARYLPQTPGQAPLQFWLAREQRCAKGNRQWPHGEDPKARVAHARFTPQGATAAAGTQAMARAAP